MSAGNEAAMVSRDLSLLAPLFADAVQAGLAECAAKQLDAYVYEAYRSDALQAIYYARGRTVKPPDRPVTNAPTNLFSWHGYGLAVDVISRAKGWNQPTEWFATVAEIMKRHDCRWGGDWTQPDFPHFQWARCRPSPSDYARQLITTDGRDAVWRVVGAARI